MGQEGNVLMVVTLSSSGEIVCGPIEVIAKSSVVKRSL